jgi:hypothetical protein
MKNNITNYPLVVLKPKSFEKTGSLLLLKTKFLFILWFNLFVFNHALAQSWSSAGTLNTARSAHSTVRLTDGKVLVVGGSVAGNNNGTKNCEIYNPANNTVSTTGSMSYSRYFHTSTLLPNGKILTVGGYGGYYHNSCELYDPSTGNWSNTGSMNYASYGHTATLLNNGKVLVAGGHGGNNLSRCELYDPSTGSWSGTGSMPLTTWGHTATLLPNGKVLVVGGATTYFGYNLTNTATIYDPSTGTWSSTGSMSTVRVWHSAVLLDNGKVLVAGGLTSNTNYLNSSELYDPSTGTWSNTGSMKSRRSSFYALKLANGNVLYAGGLNVSGYMDSCEIYDTTSASWKSTGKLNTNRDAPYALLSDGKVFIASGYNGSHLTSNELYTPTNSNCKTPAAPALSSSSTTICANQSSTLSIASGTLDSATHWQWYSGSCGGTAIDTGSSITVSPASTTTYFARGEGGCVSSAPCGSITITVNTIPVITPVDDINIQTPAGVCTYPVNFSANATGSPNPQIKFYLNDQYYSWPYGSYQYEIHSGERFSPFYAYGYPTPAKVNVIASNTCGSDTDQFIITLRGRRVDIACYGDDEFTLDSGETTYTDYTNGHGVIPGTHNMMDAQVLNHCGLGGGPYYKFSGATVSSRFTDLHRTPFNVGTTRVVAFAYDEWTGFFIEEYLFGENFNDSMLHAWADSCVFYITIREREYDIMNCIENQNFNTNFTGNKFKVLNKNLDPVKLINNASIANITNNYNNDSTLQGAQFSVGTTRILWTVTDIYNHTDTCSFTVTVSHCGASVPSGANVYSGNITINTQTQLDSFYNKSNGEKYTKISGLLTLNGNHYNDPITSLCNLSSLVEITGNLNINNFNKSANPSSLSQLANLTTLGCGLNITSNYLLQDATLASLSSIGCSVNIKDNNALQTINMPKLASVQGGQFNIKNNPKLELASASTAAGSFSFTGKGSSMDISDNGSTAAGALAMNFKKVTTLKGALVFHNNDNTGVSNFDNIFTGLTDLSTKWGKLTITNNDYLGTCCIAASVTVGGSGKRHIISGNTGNCVDSATVLANCGVFHKKSSLPAELNSGFVEFKVYPNPSSGIFNLDVMSNQTGQLNLVITDMMGRTILTETHAISQFTSLPISLKTAASGTYFLKAKMNGEVFVKRISIVR